MIDAGLFMALIALLLVIAQPFERTISHRRYERSHSMIAPLQEAIPISTQMPDEIAEAHARAKEALDADDLTRGVRDVAAVYRRAAAHRRA